MWSHAICPGLALIIILTEMSTAGQFKELQMEDQRINKLVLINELGVQVGGKDHLLFEVKGKGHVHILLAETTHIEKTEGKYYFISLAMKGKSQDFRMNGLKYGCIVCSAFMRTAAKTSVVADKFTQLWVSWKDGHVKVGDGTDMHKIPFLDYKGPQTYGVNFIYVAVAKYPAQWRFRIDNPPLFIAPSSSGLTMITIPENSPVNEGVFDIVCEDPENDNITFTVKNHRDLFFVDESTVVLKHSLDYERQRQYSVMIEAFDGLHKVLVAMGVKVVDVYDEAPVVVVSDDLSIPEELSVGSELGSFFEATDADHNDKLTFTLQGGHGYFTINETNGKLTLKRRINFDGVNGVKKIEDMTLTVTDKGNNQVKESLTITVTDINDNSPSFGHTLYRFNVTENGSPNHFNVTENGRHRTELTNFAITDTDSGGNGQFYMDLASTTYLDIFTVQGTSLMVEASKVDFERLEDQDFTYTLTVRATERSDTGATHVGKATVLVEVLPVNEYHPKWTSPKQGGNPVSFEEKTILRHEPVGTIVETFQAKDDDKGKDGSVTYRLISVKSDKGEDVPNHFFMDKYSGQLKTAYYFDIKKEIQSSFYDIIVQAIDGGSSPKSVYGNMKVNLGVGGTSVGGAGGAIGMGGAGMRGGKENYVRAGVVGTGHEGVSGSRGRNVSRFSHGGIAGTGGGQDQASGDGRADISGTDGAGRFSGRGGSRGTGDTRGTGPSRGDVRDSCDNSSSGCARGKDHQEGSGRSVSPCSTVVSYRNTEIWVMRGGCGVLFFLGAIGLLVVVWKNKNTRLPVAPVSSVSVFDPQGCPGLGEFQSSAPMDTHK